VNALRTAAESLRAGRTQEGLEAAAAVLRGAPDDAGALHLVGVALTRLGRNGEAVEALERAVGLAPRSAGCHLALGNALRRLGHPARARSSYEQALALEPDNSAAGYQLALCRHDAGEYRPAISLLHAIALRDPMDFEASHRLVSWVAEEVTRAGPARAAGLGVRADEPPAWKSISVGFCSIDPARERSARRGLEAALAPTPCEFHVVRNPPSLAQGLNRVLEAAQGELVILCHDDIEVLAPRLDVALRGALGHADIAGVAGATHAAGPAVLWAGQPHVHGWVTYPRGDELEVAPLSLRCGNIAGIEALDGVFMAMRRDVAKSLRFDAEIFDGFHFYDLDFTYRAHLAGMRLCVTTDVLLVHASEGSFDDSWRRYADRFVAKHPGLGEPQGSPHWYGARVASRGQALAFYDELRTLDRARGGTTESPHG